jgi:hypothetical protein
VKKTATKRKSDRPKTHKRNRLNKLTALILKSAEWLVVAIIGILIAEFFHLSILPHLLMQIDKMRGEEPKPTFSMRVIELIDNKKPLNFENKCDEFHKFLVESKIAFKLPSNKYLAVSAQDLKKSRPPNCEVIVPFPNYLHKHSDVLLIPTDISDMENYSNSRLTSIIVVNEGIREMDFIRAKVRLNKNWAITDITGAYIEKKDINSFMVYREHLTGGETMPTHLWIENATKAQIKPQDFILDLSVTYGSRGIEKTLDKEKIYVMYSVLIENCQANCKSPDLINVDITEFEH